MNLLYIVILDTIIRKTLLKISYIYRIIKFDITKTKLQYREESEISCDRHYSRQLESDFN